MYSFFKPILFKISPERAHRLTMSLLEMATAVGRSVLEHWYCDKSDRHATTVMGLRFPNRVGLAAGFDKDGKHIRALSALGFGFIEVGTVTPVAQDGNPQPRLFRLPADNALINRMGFNNAGLEALVGRLRDLQREGAPNGVIIGGNIGKNKVTPNEKADEDYVKCFEALYAYVDYFVVNVSSPNTPNLRALQEKEPLTNLLNHLQVANRQKSAPKPILLKIAPDLTTEQITDIVDIVRETGIAGVIATNTTISREGLKTPEKTIADIGMGGLSGAPLQVRSTEVIRLLRQQLGPDAVIIGVGGIDSAAAAQEKLRAGANLVQVYSGLVYEGPALVKRILTGI
ncbi:MAG: quinone-dependent dihydroorotate dehydrogenase [Saprospiraceae bacterium]|nr:quinone-dependent dihydroorotate dehydrogenase [Saprospiraceae bacterium]